MKRSTPARKTVRRPIRSPSRPASSRKLPKVTRNAFMTQVRLPWVKWRSCWIDGSATFTIVVSSTIISCAMQTITSASQRRRSVVDVSIKRSPFVCCMTPAELWPFSGSHAALRLDLRGRFRVESDVESTVDIG